MEILDRLFHSVSVTEGSDKISKMRATWLVNSHVSDSCEGDGECERGIVSLPNKEIAASNPSIDDNTLV